MTDQITESMAESRQKNNIHNLTQCWNKYAESGANILDECRMADMWNKRSGSYAKNTENGGRQKKADEILEFLEECGFNPRGAKILDIGCGPGTLSIPLAKLGADVTALDISSGMLERLKDAVKQESLPIHVMECSWWTADIDALGFRNEFDLVIASMTPGIKDAENFDRMMACSKKYCYYSNFLRREEDSSYREIRRSILGENLENIMSGAVFPIMYLYLSGYQPSVRINHSVFKEETGWREAAERAIEFISRGRDFEDAVKDDIMDYYQKISSNGVYCFESNVYTGMMVWEI